MAKLPSHIGKYRVIARLGQGGMACVHLCMSSGVAGFRKLMVVKQLRDELAAEPEFLSMFLDEARLAARLNHVNVVQTYEVGEEDEHYFIAMDYLEGKPLGGVLQRIGREHMPLEIHLRVLSEMLSGLHHAHELCDFDGTPLEVVHRDVSPQNVFVTYDGQVKLVDFGIAKAEGAATLTRQGVVKGKVSYMAPEQALGQRVDRRADIFSVGVMLWEALAGRRIAAGQPEAVALHQRLHHEEPALAVVAPDAPPPLVKLCERAMAFAREDRFASAEEFRDALDEWLHTRGRVTHKEIARFMSALFAEDRHALRLTIDEQLKLHEAAGAEDAPIVTIKSLLPPPPVFDAEPPVSAATRQVEVIEQTPSVSQARYAHEVERRPKPSGAGMKLGVAALVVAGAAAVFVATRPEPAPIQPVAPAVSEAAAPAPPPPAPSAASLSLELSVVPREAVVLLDGARVASNPFKATVPRDGAMHRVSASLDGYESTERVVAFDRDLTLSIVLEPRAAASAAPRVASARPTPPPSAAPPPPDEPSARPIDVKNPYKKK